MPDNATMIKPILTHRHWSAETIRLVSLMPEKGIFLTGIEGSDPAVDGVRRNQMQEAHDFYNNYESRLEKIRELGITWLRFGLPYSQAHIAKDTYDFDFMDKVIHKCEALGITVMADLLHFGLPDWMHEQEQNYPFFQNKYFPTEFAKYAAVFTRRYPHIQYYTIVNEPFVTAFFSAKLGIWNEHVGSSWDDDRAFVRAVSNVARAAILGRQAIEQVWRDEGRSGEPIFVQNESFEHSLALPGSGREVEAERFNIRRFASLDLIFGHRDPVMEDYLLSQGMLKADYEWFMEHGSSTKTILGIDHYPWCVHIFKQGETIENSALYPSSLYTVVKEYWERYPLPLLHTEVNAWPDQALEVCQKTFDSLDQLRRDGYPVLGIGWYGDDLQVGWHVAMRGPQSFEETPVGLYYKGEKQPVAQLFSDLAQRGFSEFGEAPDHESFELETEFSL